MVSLGHGVLDPLEHILLTCLMEKSGEAYQVWPGRAWSKNAPAPAGIGIPPQPLDAFWGTEAHESGRSLPAEEVAALNAGITILSWALGVAMTRNDFPEIRGVESHASVQERE
ncbi:MAG: hypothetical protein ACR2OU_02975 [Thermomicrobiales bacterium]